MSERVLLIGPVWPEPRSSAAGLRSRSLIRALQEAGWDVHFASCAKEGEASEELRASGVGVHPIRMNHPSFDSWIAGLDPDYVVFERFMTEEQFGWRVKERCPGAIRVLDTTDLHFLRRARQEALRGGTSVRDLAEMRLDLATDDALREVASVYRCDLAWVISPVERRLLVDPKGEFRVPEDQVAELGFSYDEPGLSAGWGDRSGFVMIGNFRHEPNADAVRWLRSEIWPLIRARLPQAQLDVYGAYPPREMMDLTDEASGFRVRGPARDQYEVLSRARVNLAPLRFGAGLKGKVSDGWWCGTPCAATGIAAEGMRGLADGSPLAFGGAVADDALGFAEAAVRLHEDEAFWEEASRVGRWILRHRFDHASNARALVETLLELKAAVPERRRRNFVGRMLGHQLHQGARYFARWIEQKERCQSRSGTAPQAGGGVRVGVGLGEVVGSGSGCGSSCFRQ